MHSWAIIKKHALKKLWNAGLNFGLAANFLAFKALFSKWLDHCSISYTLR